MHFSQIFLTLVRTFMCVPCRSGFTVVVQVYGVQDLRSLVAIRDTTTGEVVGSEFNLHFVAGQNSDVVHPHLSGDVRQDSVAILEFHSEHCIWE